MDAEPTAAWRPTQVRLDDLERSVGYQFAGLQTVGAAAQPEHVQQVLAAAEHETRLGRWVVCLLSYEAAEAFEPAVRAGKRHPLLPLAWFASFERRETVPPVAPPVDGAAIDDRRRVHGSGWYRSGVQTIRHAIETGGVYQVNLTDRVHCTLHGEVRDLYRAMATTQGGGYNALIEFEHVAVVSASPELFLQVDGDMVTTRPMKGTRRRHGRPDADARRAADLLASEKDRAENVMIVDLLRNDLSRVAVPGGVTVPELFRVERYETVWQMTSTVQARLRPEVGLVELLQATFPCGSITGAPKVAAMRMIDDLESTPRGLYCGSIGVLAPALQGRGSSTWSVAIRTAVVDVTTREVEFGAGGGITYDSVPEDEDDELESKTVVLGGARREFALFETVRFDADGVHHMDRHLRRLALSADYFGFQFDPHLIRRQVAGLTPVTALHRLRLTLSRVGTVDVEVLPVTPAAMPVKLGVAAERVRSDDPFCCHKTTNRAVYDRARAALPAVDDVVMVNERGEVVETTIANLLYRRAGRWFTPPLTSGGLPGIEREVLIERGEVTERVLTVAELADCEALEVVSALRGRRAAILVA